MEGRDAPGELVVDVSSMWVEYDRNTDTLYINFEDGEPEESVLISDNIIVNSKGGRLLSIVVTEFSRHTGLG